MGSHAILSASSSHRWLSCTPSARLEENFENPSSVFAEEGTAAHEISEYKLRQHLGINEKKPESKFENEEMDNYTDIYVDFAIELITEAKSRCKDPIILVEQKLDFSNYVPEGFGTGDLVIVADNTLDIVDLKYGKGIAVSAQDNSQMKLYALGALNLFDSLYDIENIVMTIVQPRLESISSFTILVDDLIAWAETELKEKAELAIKGEGDFCAGGHCRFCRARYTCRERAEAHLKFAQHDFKLPALLSDEEISEVLEIADRLSEWASDVYLYAADAALREGKHWDGFKLVEGRANRKFTSEEDVIQKCIENGYEDIYRKSLKGITDMEKLIGKKKFNELLGSLVEKPKGKPTLVPITDKRKEISLNNTAEADFKEEK